jgi:hypothetical protein
MVTRRWPGIQAPAHGPGAIGWAGTRYPLRAANTRKKLLDYKDLIRRGAIFRLRSLSDGPGTPSRNSGGGRLAQR